MRDEQAIGVGARAPQGTRRYTATCGECGCTVHFRDRLPSLCPITLCTECFLDVLEKIPKGEKLQLVVTPENIDAYAQLFALANKPAN
jgi:hypothetical protein